MKKLVLILAIISVLGLTGCSLFEKTNNVNDSSDIGNSFVEENEEENKNIVTEEIIDGESEESIKKQLIGNKNWPAREVFNKNGENIALNIHFGSGVSYSNEGFVFNEDNTFSCFVGVWGESDADYRGTYSIDVNNREITLNYNSGRITKAKYSLSENNMVLDLTEEKEDYMEEMVKILYTPAQKENDYLVNEVKTKLLNKTWVLNTNGANPEDDEKILMFNADGTFYSEKGDENGQYHTGEYMIYPEYKQITLVYEDVITREILLIELDENNEITKMLLNGGTPNVEYIVK